MLHVEWHSNLIGVSASQCIQRLEASHAKRGITAASAHERGTALFQTIRARDERFRARKVFRVMSWIAENALKTLHARQNRCVVIQSHLLVYSVDACMCTLSSCVPFFENYFNYIISNIFFPLSADSWVSKSTINFFFFPSK